MPANTIHHLSCDIETYSDIDIGKAGLYKYAESPAFSVLLFAYSLDGAPVQVVDLTADEKIPADITEHLFGQNTIKHAYNASFEITCLSRYFDRQLPPSQWRCTMIHGMYLGYPAGLDACGKALGLPQDKQKMSVGKAVISASPASPQRPTETVFATSPTMTPQSGSCSRNIMHRT